MHATINDVPLEMKVDGIETRGMACGGVTIRHLDLPAGVDFTPLFKGLSDDLCQCPHWGYVTAGSITLRKAAMATCRLRALEVASASGHSATSIVS